MTFLKALHAILVNSMDRAKVWRLQVKKQEVLRKKFMQSKFAFSNIFIIGLVSLFIDMSIGNGLSTDSFVFDDKSWSNACDCWSNRRYSRVYGFLLKVFSGYIGDVYQNKKKLTFIGYSAAIVYKVALLLSASWTGVLAARSNRPGG